MSLPDHYETVRDRHGYDRVEGIDALSGLERRFVAVDGRETVAAAPDRPTLVCMGIGMTGPPHLGTVGQVLTAVELQDAGFDVQFVLADLEPYHAGADSERVGRLAERYRKFALDLGFDQGILRTQSEARAVMATGHRLARYYALDEWEGHTDGPETDWEQAVRDAYERGETDNGGVTGNEAPTSAAADAHSGVLHGADFLHPLTEGYERVLLVFGIDEHGLTPWTRRFRDASPVEGQVAGLYTRIVPGFSDAPKMSKSIDAGLSLDAPPERIRERIVHGDDATDPARSAVFAAMCLASRYDSSHLDRLETCCRQGGEGWARSRREYADYVTDLARRWRATAE